MDDHVHNSTARCGDRSDARGHAWVQSGRQVLTKKRQPKRLYQPAFFDDSPNASGKWCDAKRSCGNRLNMRRFIRRHPKYYKYRTVRRRAGR